MQREWGAPAPSFPHCSDCESEVRTSLTRHKLCVRRPVERDMKRNENCVFTSFFFFNQARPLGLWANWIGQFIPQHEKKKTASLGNSFPLWEIYDCISVSVSWRTASSAHLGHVSHSPLWQMSSARRVSGLHCCTSSSARSTSALRPRTLRLNVMHGACRKKVLHYSGLQNIPFASGTSVFRTSRPELTLHMQSTLQRIRLTTNRIMHTSCEPEGAEWPKYRPTQC